MPSRSVVRSALPPPDVTGSLEPGFRVGHWSDLGARTGCTVVLPPPGNVCSCEIRGSSPGSRELELLHPDRRLTEVHAVLLTGGSAFGLAAADGVVGWLEGRGVGYDAKVARVPIVPAAVVFDLGVGSPEVRPGPAEGRAACDAAVQDGVGRGRIGAGTGATAGKWAGTQHCVPAGLGLGAAESGGLRLSAVAVVNPVGDVVAEDGSVLAGSAAPEPRWRPPKKHAGGVVTNTVLTVVTVLARLDKRDVRWLAARAADGVTRSVRPSHTRYDGDVSFAIAAPGPGRRDVVDVDLAGQLAADAVAAAVRDAVASG